jgi:osmotically-inducible protein OsmY
MNRRYASALALVAGLFLFSGASIADSPDTWITTKAKITLFTTDGVHATDVNVDTVNGTVTLHGKVSTKAEKSAAEHAVRRIDGVKGVNNQLQVVPESRKKATNATDSQVKDAVEKTLKADHSLEGVKVQSVNKGVVLLAGSTPDLDHKLRAIERVYNVDGVRKVATEIETKEK